MGHDHGHSHGHDHTAEAGGDRRRLAAALGVTLFIMAVGIVGAAVSGSLALLADAGHMLTDAIGLAVALGAATLAARPPTMRRTWGFRRAEVIAAAAQALLLLAVGVFVIVEAIRRLFAPPEVSDGPMLLFGIAGLLGNLVSLWILMAGRGNSFNLRAAFLEVLSDALGSVAVIVGAIVIATTGWTRADAIASLFIGAFIIPRTLTLLRDTTQVLLASTPKGLDLEEVRRHILAMDHVEEVHDLHAELIATGVPVLTGHVVIRDACLRDGHAMEILRDLQECVATHFDVPVEHSTFQLETAAHAGDERIVH
ncbi:cation diffusion facilitator family transporter [Dietzia sp.]|uniref:cation diffusion facilitator family transporter n=1 Tax=Dietzia sp. TaxID=1871616 RepID=UPI002FD90729